MPTAAAIVRSTRSDKENILYDRYKKIEQKIIMIQEEPALRQTLFFAFANTSEKSSNRLSSNSSTTRAEK